MATSGPVAVGHKGGQADHDDLAARNLFCWAHPHAAAWSNTERTCSTVTPGNQSTNSEASAPSSRFSKRAETGTRVPRNTHAPLTRCGSRSTAEHVDQSIMDKWYHCCCETANRYRAPNTALLPTLMSLYGLTWTRPRCECRQIACSRPACRSAPSLMLLLTVLREARHGPSLLHAIWSLRGHVLSDVEDRLQSYIRPTYAASVLIAAGPGGIRRKTPHLLQGLAARVHIQASVFRGRARPLGACRNAAGCWANHNAIFCFGRGRGIMNACLTRPQQLLVVWATKNGLRGPGSTGAAAFSKPSRYLTCRSSRSPVSDVTSPPSNPT